MKRKAKPGPNSKRPAAPTRSPQRKPVRSGGPSDGDLPWLAAPARRALASAGIARLEQCTKFTDDELLALHGMGPNAMHTLRQALKARGLNFRR
ncbi:MAG: hypothetical protein AB7O59_11665 [Pirellulales bacterium]